MLNAETYKLEVKRIELCDILLALCGVMCELRDEANDPNTTEERREIAKRSAAKWERLHEIVKEQIDNQDIGRGFIC